MKTTGDSGPRHGSCAPREVPTRAPPVGASMPHVEQVTTDEGLERLVPVWQHLWARVPNATPFQAPAWLLPWWRCFGTSRPVVIAAYEGATLQGLLPLYRLQEAGSRKLLPIGVSLSDYFDALVDPSSPSIADVLLRALTQVADWDDCVFPELRAGAALLEAVCPNGLSDDRIVGAPCLVLELPAQGQALREVVPKKLWRNVHQARQRASAAGGLRVTLASPDTLATCMDELFRLHERRWGRRREAGVLADPRVREFHRRAAPRLQEAGMLRSYLLHIGGAPVAAYYGFNAKRAAYAYLGGFDPDVPRLSPGTLILAHAIEEAVAEGARQFHFLRGPEPYKYAWGAKDRTNTTRILRPRC